MKRFLIGLVIAVFAAIGIAEASMVYQQGRGSDGRGIWRTSPGGNVYLAGRQVFKRVFATLGTEGTTYFYVPEACTITAAYTVLLSTISSADERIRLAIGTTGAEFTSITITQSGSAVGDIDSSTGLTQTVSAGQLIAMGNAGLSGGTTDSAEFTVICDTTQ